MKVGIDMYDMTDEQEEKLFGFLSDAMDEEVESFDDLTKVDGVVEGDCDMNYVIEDDGFDSFMAAVSFSFAMSSGDVIDEE